MPALNFQSRFVAKVQSGVKAQTIRLRRKRPIKVGAVLYLYTGMRTRSCRLIRKGVCRKTDPLLITDVNGSWLVVRAGRELDASESQLLAESDGFNDLAEMMTWFLNNHDLPFEGDVIYW